MSNSYIWNSVYIFWPLNRLWRVYTYPFSSKKNWQIFFPCWYDGAICLDQESRGVDPPTPTGGSRGWHNPHFDPQNPQLQRAGLGLPRMEFLIFQLIPTGNDMNFHICQIHGRVFWFGPETSRQSLGIFRIAFFQFFSNPARGYGMIGFQIP